MEVKSIYPIINFSDEDEIAVQYERLGADGVIIISPDFSDEAMLIKKIRNICEKSDCRLYIWQPYRRLEDIKKVLYAGAAGAWIEATEQTLIREASDRFGADRVGMVISEPKLAADEFKLAKELNLTNIFVTGTIEKLPETVGNQKVIATCRYENKEGQKHLLADANVSAIALIYENETAALPNIHAMKAALETDSVKFNLFRSSLPFSSFKLNEDGLIPVIVQDFRTAEILMMAYMNEEAYEQTLREGMMTYWSRSRQELWRKGDTSGHYQYVKSLDIDCDRDTILAKVEQIGAACHTGHRSCFYTNLASKAYDGRNPMTVFDDVMATILERKENPKEGSYTNYLFDQGIDKILKKVGEEAAEIIIAAKNPDSDEVKYEICDFLYHMMVLMAEREVSWKDITKELAERH